MEDLPRPAPPAVAVLAVAVAAALVLPLGAALDPSPTDGTARGERAAPSSEPGLPAWAAALDPEALPDQAPTRVQAHQRALAGDVTGILSPGTPAPAGPAGTVAADEGTDQVPPWAEARSSQVLLSRELLRTVDDPAAAPAEGTFQAASLALDHRRSLAGDRLPAGTAPALEGQARNVEAAREHVAVDEAYGAAWARSLDRVRLGTEHQAAALGLEATGAPATPSHETPSAALAELARRHGGDLPDDHRARLEALDEPVRSNLTRVVDAFLALEAASEAAYGEADLAPIEALEARRGGVDPSESPTTRDEALARLQAGDADLTDLHPVDLPPKATGPGPAEALDEADLDLAPVLAARTQFLEAADALRTALAEDRPSTSFRCRPFLYPPVYIIDLEECDNTHEYDVALLVDAGGKDTYLNNAGGSNLAGGACDRLEVGTAAALVDVGSRNDTYGDPAGAPALGAHGGGDRGVGLVLDQGGDDTYVARDFGTNGGGSLGGVGLILDQSGSDTYEAGSLGTNGGGELGGAGFVLDASGSDRYEAGALGTNGGGAVGVGVLMDSRGTEVYRGTRSGVNGGAEAGTGFLLDEGGADDAYHGTRSGVNGGGALGGVGFLADTGGNELYNATRLAVNGGAELGGSGALLDVDGHDRYVASEASDAAIVSFGGANGGGAIGGSGLLVDGSGDDLYQGRNNGANGGATSGAAGFLLDASGEDVYEATAYGTNGGAALGGIGYLLDPTGSDLYDATAYGTNGGGDVGGAGFLWDGLGSDTYRATKVATNGGGALGAGFLADGSGDDAFRADGVGTNGGAAVGGAGILVAVAGDDIYEAGGNGTNGGGYTAGSGLLYDVYGNDDYLAGRCGTNGGSARCIPIVFGVYLDRGVGHLQSRGGFDVYKDPLVPGGSCADCSIVPKAPGGAQVDESDPRYLSPLPPPIGR